MEPSLQKLLEKIKGGKLKDGDTLPKPKSFEIEKAMNKSVALGSGNRLNVKLGGSLEGSIALINSNDKAERVNDPEGVLLKPTYDDADLQAVMDPRPLLPFKDDTAYLCYRLGVQANIGGAATIDLTALDFEAEKKLSSCFYSSHELSGDQARKTIGEAVLDDLGIDLDSGQDQSEAALKKVGSLFDSDSAGSLPVGSAMTFVASGNLRSSVEVDAGELLAASMTYSGLFEEAIPFSYDAGFKLGANLEIGGDFYLGVAATREGELTVVVRRASARNIGLNGSLGVSAEVDFSETAGVINDFIGGVSDLPRNRVETMLKAVNNLVDRGRSGIDTFVNDLGGGQLPKAVSDLYDKLVEDLEGRLTDWIAEKSDRILEPLEKLEDKLESWQKQLQRYAKRKLELSFGFQYNKLDQSADLLRLTCY